MMDNVVLLIVHYHGNPKLWNHMIWGPLMVILALHHFFEHMTHELLPKEGTMTLVANTVWTTFTCCVYHFYGASYGYYNVFYRLAAEPTFVFFTVLLEVIKTHAGCGTNWTLGNPLFFSDEERTGYPMVVVDFAPRAVLFVGINIMLGAVAKEYFKIHKEAAAAKAKIGGHK